MEIPTSSSTFLTRAYKNNKNSYPAVYIISEAYGESGNRVVAPAVKQRCKTFGTISIPSISSTITVGFLFRNFLLLLFKFSQGKYDLEWYKGSAVLQQIMQHILSDYRINENKRYGTRMGVNYAWHQKPRYRSDSAFIVTF